MLFAKQPHWVAPLRSLLIPSQPSGTGWTTVSVSELNPNAQGSRRLLKDVRFKRRTLTLNVVKRRQQEQQSHTGWCNEESGLLRKKRVPLITKSSPDRDEMIPRRTGLISAGCWLAPCLITSPAPVQYNANKEERKPGHVQSPTEISHRTDIFKLPGRCWITLFLSFSSCKVPVSVWVKAIIGCHAKPSGLLFPILRLPSRSCTLYCFDSFSFFLYRSPSVLHCTVLLDSKGPHE